MGKLVGTTWTLASGDILNKCYIPAFWWLFVTVCAVKWQNHPKSFGNCVGQQTAVGWQNLGSTVHPTHRTKDYTPNFGIKIMWPKTRQELPKFGIPKKGIAMILLFETVPLIFRVQPTVRIASSKPSSFQKYLRFWQTWGLNMTKSKMTNRKWSKIVSVNVFKAWPEEQDVQQALRDEINCSLSMTWCHGFKTVTYLKNGDGWWYHGSCMDDIWYDIWIENMIRCQFDLVPGPPKKSNNTTSPGAFTTTSQLGSWCSSATIEQSFLKPGAMRGVAMLANKQQQQTNNKQ